MLLYQESTKPSIVDSLPQLPKLCDIQFSSSLGMEILWEFPWVFRGYGISMRIEIQWLRQPWESEGRKIPTGV